MGKPRYLCVGGKKLPSPHMVTTGVEYVEISAVRGRSRLTSAQTPRVRTVVFSQFVIADPKTSQYIYAPRPRVKCHPVARAATRPDRLLVPRHDAPLALHDRVHPKVVQALLAVPTAVEVYPVCSLVDAHRVSPALPRRAAACARAAQTRPRGLCGCTARERVEETCICGELEYAFGFRPVAVGYDAIVELGDERVLELNVHARGESFERRHETVRAKMLEDVPEGHRVRVLRSVINQSHLGRSIILGHTISCCCLTSCT